MRDATRQEVHQLKRENGELKQLVADLSVPGHRMHHVGILNRYPEAVGRPSPEPVQMRARYWRAVAVQSWQQSNRGALL